MPKFTKGHYSYPEAIGPFNFLLITANQFTKFQGSSSDSIWDILLIREKCPNLQRAITPEIFFRIYSKLNQVIYSSLPINSPSFKAVARTVFEIFCGQGKNAQNYKGCLRGSKLYRRVFVMRSSTHHYQSIHQVSRLSPQQFLRYFADKVNLPKITKGHNSWSISQNLFKS